MTRTFIIIFLIFISSVCYSKETSLVCDFKRIEITTAPNAETTIIDRAKADNLYLKKETINFDLNKKQVLDSSLFIIYNYQTKVGYKLGKIIETDPNIIGFKGVDQNNRELIVTINRLTGELLKRMQLVENNKYKEVIQTYYNCQNKEKLF
jgi:hypothetical protein